MAKKPPFQPSKKYEASKADMAEDRKGMMHKRPGKMPPGMPMMKGGGRVKGKSGC